MSKLIPLIILEQTSLKCRPVCSPNFQISSWILLNHLKFHMSKQISQSSLSFTLLRCSLNSKLITSLSTQVYESEYRKHLNISPFFFFPVYNPFPFDYKHMC